MLKLRTTLISLPISSYFLLFPPRLFSVWSLFHHLPERVCCRRQRLGLRYFIELARVDVPGHRGRDAFSKDVRSFFEIVA